MSLTLKARNAKGDCDCCPNTDVMLTPSRHDSSMMMCPTCFTQEAEATATIAKAEKVITESRQNDSKIILKEDVMTATTTAFIEIHGAILANPAIPADRKQYALAEEVSARIDSLQATIFAKKAELAALENERFGWLKNLQPLVSTFRADEQAKWKPYNVNYKPVDVTITKIKKVTKVAKQPSSGVEWTPNTPIRVRKPSIAKVKEACEVAGVDRTIISSMLNSSKNGDLTLDEVIQKHIRITRD